MSRRRIAALLALIVLTLAALWWRWVWLPPSELDLVRARIELPAGEHPLDALLRKHLPAIAGSPALLAQLRRAPETFRMRGLLMDACEVTQGQFRRFAHWRAAQVQPPPLHPSTPPQWEFKSQTREHQLLGQLPVAAGGLSYHDAWAYCRAVGGRLPTAAEFEAIAGGAEQRLYPWGNAFDNSAWPSADPSLNIARQCGAHPATDSPEGIRELGSSLLEWADGGAEGPVLMGGNAWHRPRALHALNFIRRAAAADFRSAYTGFRCVYDRPLPPGGAMPLPWGESSKVASVPGGERPIGPAANSRIAPLLRALKNEEIGVLKYLPIAPKALDLQVMRNEVSRAMYARFLRDPLARLGFFNHPKHPPHIRHKPEDWPRQRQEPRRPVTGVSWWSAWAFANWAGGDLPTAEQWELLAGSELQRFPYGNDYIPGRAVDRNFRPDELHSAAVDDSNDAGPLGIIGLGGNAAEWTSTTVLRGNSFNLVIKGGSYLMPAAGTQITQTSEAVPDYQSEDLGFRLVFPL